MRARNHSEGPEIVELNPAISRYRKFLAYSSDESSCGEELVRRFPGARRFIPIVSDKVLSFLLVEDSVVDVRPKLLKEVRSSVDRYIREPKLIGFAEGAFPAGVIET